MQNLAQQKQPIVNGSINPTLSLAEMQAFDAETKVRLLWNMQVEMESGYSHSSKIDHRVYIGIPKRYEYQELKEMDEAQLNTALEVSQNILAKHRSNLIAKTVQLHREMGAQIYEAQKRLGFKAEIEMSLAKLEGYLGAIGHWNDCNPNNICPVLCEIDANCPRVDYGVNNPNTGSEKHTWSTTGEYVFLTVDYISETEKEKWIAFFNSFVLPKQDRMKADSLRYICEQYEAGYITEPRYEFKIVIWWD